MNSYVERMPRSLSIKTFPTFLDIFGGFLPPAVDVTKVLPRNK